MKRLDIDDAVPRYLAGESVEQIAESHGVSANPIRRILKEQGVIRPLSEAQRMRHGSPEIDEAEAVRLYLGGESEKAVAARFGSTRYAIRKILMAGGVPIRGRSDAMFLRMAKASPEERLALAEAAHAAVRGVPHSDEHREKIAATREARKSQASPAEIAISNRLRFRGIEVVRRMAIGRYNVDLAIAESAVAVEIFGGHWHGSGEHARRHRERLEYLLDRGWLPIIIWITKTFPLSYRAIDYVVARHEARRRGEPFAREEHVIRGDGEGGPVSEGYPVSIPRIVGPEA